MSEHADLRAVRNPRWPTGITADELLALVVVDGYCRECNRVLGEHDGMCLVPFLQQALSNLSTALERLGALEKENLGLLDAAVKLAEKKEEE